MINEIFLDVYVLIIFFFFSFLFLSFVYNYILRLLIIAELMVVNLALFIFLVLKIENIEIFVIYFLVFRVCERVIGLGLLVLIVRFRGNDFYYMFNMRKFYDKIYYNNCFYKFHGN